MPKELGCVCCSRVRNRTMMEIYSSHSFKQQQDWGGAREGRKTHPLLSRMQPGRCTPPSFVMQPHLAAREAGDRPLFWVIPCPGKIWRFCSCESETVISATGCSLGHPNICAYPSPWSLFPLFPPDKTPKPRLEAAGSLCAESLQRCRCGTPFW